MRKTLILVVLVLISVFVPVVVNADMTIMPIKSSDWGDATLLESGGEYLLMDVTYGYSKDVVNFLNNNKVNKFDIYLSHYHTDHYGAGNAENSIENIIKMEYKVDKLYLPDIKMCENNDNTNCKNILNTYNKLVAAAGANGVEVVILSAGTEFQVGDTKAKVLYLDTDANVSNVNNNSLVTMFTNGNIKFLTAGDIESETEEKLLESGIDISADIFKLNHHSIQTTKEISNTKAFIDAVKPKYSYFTFDLNNQWGYTYNDIAKSINNLSGFSNLYVPSVNENVSFVIENDVITPIAEKNAYTVTINYIDKDSNEILYTKKADFNYNLFGRSVKYYLYDYAKNFEGYTLVDDLEENEISGVLSENVTYNIYYAKNVKEENPKNPDDSENSDTEIKTEPEEKNPQTGIKTEYGLLILIALIGSISYLLIRKKSKFLKHN